jgi:hypothetical protein
MAKWFVQIAGDESDLKELGRVMHSDRLEIIKEDNEYWLLSPKFDQCEGAAQVNSITDELLDILNGIVRLVLGSRKKIIQNSILKINDDGTKERIISVQETVHVRSSVSIAVRRSNGTIERYYQADPIPDWVILANSDDNVRKVMRLFGKGVNEWTSVYRVYEVIRHDMHGDSHIVENEWTTQRQVERFRRTANSVTAAGDDARHGVEIAEPPSNPMQLTEAIAFIENLVHNWIRWKQSKV